jgi:hypothetical protein
MRSLTHSSAGIPIPVPLTAPAHCPNVVLAPTHTAVIFSHTPSASTGTSAGENRHPSLPSPIIHSFFNVSDNSQALSSKTRDSVNQAIQSGWASTTIKRYSGSIRQFIRFCDSEGVPEHLRFPTDEFVLCAFAASSLGRHGGGTPRNRLSALKAWHVAHNIDWKGSARLRYVLNGVTNRAPGKSRHTPRPPINAKMISQLIEHLDTDSPFDAAVAACATTAFWGQCRLGELLPLTSSTPPPNPLPIRSDFRRSKRNPQSCLLHLPRTKTHHHGQDIVLVDQLAPINPIFLLKNHFRVNNVLREGYMFSYSSANGPLTLTKPLFLQRCNAIWGTLGYPRTTGHCFRIGGTTELLLAGTPPEVVKATGRWTSESFLRYWRSLDDLAPQYIRHLHNFKHKRRT